MRTAGLPWRMRNSTTESFTAVSASQIPSDFLPVVLLDPVQERGAEVEAQVLVVVDDVLDAPGTVQHSRSGVGRVTFHIDTFVPVVERISRSLPVDVSRPRVFPRRLIEMAVQN